MKDKIHLILCLAALTVQPLWAGDKEPTHFNIEEKIRAIDLSVTLRLYEKVRMEIMEIEFEVRVPKLNEILTKDQSEKKFTQMIDRMQSLEAYAHELKTKAKKLAVGSAVEKVK
ncbi:MAG: hypothetical protein O2960_27660 [Verrucomicrobia bacterium]|nr:hypothetical protein [Verrucomicrobiota bacterium]